MKLGLFCYSASSTYPLAVLVLASLCVPAYSLQRCDISDTLIHSITDEALTVWSLLDLAEHESIVDQELFYDEFCQSLLRLCKEVQQFNETGYQLSDKRIDEFEKLFCHLNERFSGLTDLREKNQRYSNAITVIFHYVDYFLKNNLGIDA